jgi:uncharacterized membrane-anchored protein
VNKKILFPAFILIALVQLYVPVSMILGKEKVISQGEVYRFRTQPVDPSDPFRGKYINLSFEENSIRLPNASEWYEGDPVYVILATDEKGFAKIDSLTKDLPATGDDYVKASISYIIHDTVSHVTIQYPFERFYMEESKATNAELAYNEALRDSAQITYALVSIKDGDAVIRDVLINGIPIREAAKNFGENNN